MGISPGDRPPIDKSAQYRQDFRVLLPDYTVFDRKYNRKELIRERFLLKDTTRRYNVIMAIVGGYVSIKLAIFAYYTYKRNTMLNSMERLKNEYVIPKEKDTLEFKPTKGLMHNPLVYNEDTTRWQFR